MDNTDIRNPKIKAVLSSLKHYSSSIENDVLDASEEAANEDELIMNAQSVLESLYNEVTQLNNEIIKAGPGQAEKTAQQACCDHRCGATCPLSIPGEQWGHTVW